MTKIEPTPHGTVLQRVTDALCSPASFEQVSHRDRHDVPMPSAAALEEVVGLLQSILFPGFFGPADLQPATMPFYVGSALDRAARLLAEQVERGLCFACQETEEEGRCLRCAGKARETADLFLLRLPEVRRLLATDVEAAYEGDPAATSPGEAIFCYPSIRALTHHRLAHELHLLGVPLIPRIISELAHAVTGIDIHPGAVIGERFFMDHGTGIVIGATCRIGRGVRVYQGVTLGARSFPLDERGRPIKGIPRHPIVEDAVILYSGATVLGRVTIGRGSVIGGNVWLTRSVPPGSRVLQGRAEDVPLETGAGI
jgi:serine O-acetyltransferase